MLDGLAIGALSFIAGAFISPLISGKARKLGEKFKNKEKMIINQLKDEDIKRAVVEFMHKLNEQLGSEEGKKKMNLTIEFMIKLLTSRIPGKIDDIILPAIIRPFIQSLYEGYIK